MAFLDTSAVAGTLAIQGKALRELLEQVLTEQRRTNELLEEILHSSGE